MDPDLTETSQASLPDGEPELTRDVTNLHLGPNSSSTSSSGHPTTDMRARIHCFSEQAPDALIHYQIMDLGLQLYIWIAVGGAKLQNMYLAIQSKQGTPPAVATLLPDATSSTASSLAQRLARRIGRPVVCSCNLPSNSDTLQVIAERRLVQELKSLNIISTSAASANSSSTAAAAAAITASPAAVAGSGAAAKGECLSVDGST